MKITNQTRYDTRAIRRLLTATHNELARAGEGRLQWWMLIRFNIIYANQRRGCSGRASIRGTWAKLRLVRPEPTERELEWVRRLRAAGSAKCEAHADGLLDRATMMRQEVGDLADVAWHEMLHLHGYRHAVMGGEWGGRPNAEQQARIVAAAGFKLATDPLPLLAPPKPKAPPTKGELQLLRYERVLAREVAWGRKLRRAQTALRRVRRQRAYYERELAASQPPKEAP